MANDRGIEKVYPTIDENSWEHKFYLDAHDKAESQPPIERQIQPDGTIKFVTWSRDWQTNNKKYIDLEDY